MLIAAGLLGMLLLLGFLALRLLVAAIFSLLYLLLAPAIVLAPAFGDGGRALFRRWISQLLGTITAKLIYSFLLGIVMAVLAVIASLSAIGWWTQWLLMSALWWGAFIHRHHALGVARGASGGDGRSQSITRRLGGMLEKPIKLAARHREKRKQDKPAPPVERRPDVDARGSTSANPAADAGRTMPQEDGTPAEDSKPDPGGSIGELIAEKGRSSSVSAAHVRKLKPAVNTAVHLSCRRVARGSRKKLRNCAMHPTSVRNLQIGPRRRSRLPWIGLAPASRTGACLTSETRAVMRGATTQRLRSSRDTDVRSTCSLTRRLVVWHGWRSTVPSRYARS